MFSLPGTAQNGQSRKNGYSFSITGHSPTQPSPIVTPAQQHQRRTSTVVPPLPLRYVALSSSDSDDGTVAFYLIQFHSIVYQPGYREIILALIFVRLFTEIFTLFGIMLKMVRESDVIQ